MTEHSLEQKLTIPPFKGSWRLILIPLGFN